MGRVILWAAILAGLCAAGWCMFGEGEPASPAYGPLADLDGEEVEVIDGPGLVGREGGSAVDEVPIADGDASIPGIVVDQDGKPLSGIRVGAAPHRKWVAATNANQRRTALAMFEPLQGTQRKPTAFATTEADGTFRIEGLEDNRQYSLMAAVEAPRVASMPQYTARRTTQSPARIVVGPGSALKGRVVDGSGVGIKADVLASSRSSLGAKPWLGTWWTHTPFTTGSDGRFTMDAVPNGTLSFTVHVAGVGKRSGILIDTPTTDEVVLRLELAEGATIEGRVTDTKGMPIAGAKLSFNSGPEAHATQRTSISRAVVSAEDGTYKVTGLSAPGVLHNANAYADGYVPSGNLANQMPLSKDRVARVDVILVKGVTIKGRVLDTEGQPIGGAEVAATRMGQGNGGWFAQLASATSAADGTYTLENVALGSGLVQARLEGHYMPPTEHGASNPYPWMQNAMQGTPYEAKDEGQAFEGKDVVLTKGVLLEGTVVDESGAPLTDAMVTAQKQNQGWSPGLANLSRHQVRTDGEGRFTFAGLEPDKTWNLTARSPTHITEKAEPVIVPKDGALKEEPKLVAKLGATVVGVVTEEGGEGVSGVAVNVNGASPQSAYTAGDGSFELSGLMPGTWSVVAQGLNPTPEGAQHKVTLEWGKTVEDIALSMPPTYTIRGTVEDEDGALLSGISVRARMKTSGRNRRGGSKYATTNANGVFEILGVLEGEYTLYAGTGKEEGVSSGATDVRIVMTQPDRILVEGRVFDADSQPVTRGTVRVYTGPSGKRRNAVNAPISGGFFVARVTTTESAVDIEVTGAFDAAGRSLNFVKKREKDMSLSGDISLYLDAGMTVSGTVRAQDGRPLAGMQVRVQKKGQNHYNPWGNQHGGNGGQARSDDEGRWTVKGLKEGDYNVDLTPGGDWMTPASIPVRAGDEGIEIKLVKGLTIEGVVKTAEGEPLTGANVWLAETQASKKSRGTDKQGHNWMDSMRLRTTTGADGSFVIKGLPEEALFNVSAAGNGPLQPYISETINDVAAGTKTVELSLRLGAMIEGEVIGPDGEMPRNGWINAIPIGNKKGRNQVNTHLNGRQNTFKLGPVAPGRYKVQVQIHGGNLSAPEAIEVTAPVKGLRIQLKKAAAIQGTLIGSDVKGFIVTFGQNNSFKTGHVQEDGSWKIDGAQHTSGTLYAYKAGDDRYARMEGAEPGKGPYDLQLVVGESISGRFEGWDGDKRKPNLYAQTSGRWIQGVVRDDGTWSITGLPPGGKYMIQGWVNQGSIKAVQNIEPGATDVVMTITWRDQ